MMDSMRNAAKSWVAKLLIGLLAVSFGVWGIADVFTGYSRGALATVGKTEITADAFSQAFNQYLQNYSRETGQGLTPEEARALGVDRAVLNNLIQSAAIDNQATRLGLAVSDRFLAQEATENPAFHNASGQFDAEQFKRLLNANGLSEAGYFAEQRRSRLREAVSATVDGDLPVPKALVEAQYRHRNEQRDARYFDVTTAESEITPPTDAEIQKAYEDNPAAYTAPEYRTLAVMKAEPADIAPKIQLTDQDIAAGYERYKGDYFTPERRTILQLSFPTVEEATAAKEKLAAGTDFLALAKERGFTETDITFADKSKGDFFDPAIAAAAFALAEGAVSEPVKGTLATVLLKAVKIVAEHQSTLDEVRAELGERLKLERAREDIQSIYDAVEDARAATTPFDEIATRSGIPFQLITTDAQGRDKAGQAIEMPQRAELLKAAFGSDVGVENDAISLDDGYVWYEVREVVPSAVKPFDAVKDQARAAVVAQKVRERAAEKAKALVEKLKSGATFEALAKEAGTEVKTAQGLKRRESTAEFSPAAVEAMFAIPENQYTHSVEPETGLAKIMQSQAVLLPAFDPASADARTIGEQIETAAANDILSSYLASLQNEAGVTVNETLWRQISGQQTP